ncbi:MAG: hypothetical protein QOH71_154 [Blastocatellia bacterium]|nr:hypothetical protein [Blastocatellia bacterium]
MPTLNKPWKKPARVCAGYEPRIRWERGRPVRILRIESRLHAGRYRSRFRNLNLKLIPQRYQSFLTRRGRAAKEYQVRAFLKNQQPFSLLI